MQEFKTPGQSPHLQDPILYGGVAKNNLHPGNYGLAAGFGVHVESPKDNLAGASIKAMKGDIFAGTDRKGEKSGLGASFTGAEVKGRLGTEKSPAMLEASGKMFDAGAQLTASKDTLEGSWSGDIVSAGIKGQLSTLGRSNRDKVLGGEASLGLGAGAKGALHYGDEDGDGFREYGFTVGGKILGGGSLTYKSEDPLGDLPLVGAARDLISPNTNLTHATGNALKSAGESVSGAWNSLWGKSETPAAATEKKAETPAAAPEKKAERPAPSLGDLGVP